MKTMKWFSCLLRKTEDTYDQASVSSGLVVPIFFSHASPPGELVFAHRTQMTHIWIAR